MSAGTSRRWSPWLLSVTVVVWALLLIRAVPGVLWDRGVFVSTAERLLAGDRLYAEVWDNKDPLFYYTLALGRTVSPLMDVVLEYGWLAAACAGVLLLARWLHCDTATSVLAGLIVAPVILTGAFYLPGHTHLPGTAVVLLALAATAHRRYVCALLGIVFFLKVLYIPLAVAMLAVVVIRRRSWRAAAFIAGGFALIAGLITAVLQIRGELGPYLNMLRANVTYTQGPLTGSVLDDLARKGGDIDVFVISGEGGQGTRPSFKFPKAPLVALPMLAAVVGVAVLTAGLLAAYAYVGYLAAYAALLALVVLVAGAYGRYPGALAGLAAAFAYQTIWIRPAGATGPPRPLGWLLLALLAGIGLYVGELTERLRRQARFSLEREQRTQALLRFGLELAQGGASTRVTEVAVRHLA